MLAFGSAAEAQDPPAATDEAEILVTAPSDKNRQVRDFVDALAQAPGAQGQLARFERSACPIVLGLPEAQNRAVATRMRRVAEAAGVPLGGSQCLPNVLVMVTRDKPAFLAELARDRPYLFDGMSTERIRRIVREPGPATSWQVNGPLVDADGVEIPSVRLNPNSPPVLVNDTLRSPSRITAAVRSPVSAAVLVVDFGALEGLTTTQLADYAAMRTFGRTDPSKLPEGAPPTILNILDAPMGAPVPITLTRWDIGFLRGLYTSDDTLYAAPRRSQIGRILQETLKQEEAERN